MAESAHAPAPAPQVEADEGGPEIAILFVAVALFIGTISRQILSRTRIPYTVALLVIGMALGALEHGMEHNLGSFGESIRLWSNIDPNLILYVFLPGLLFESSYSMEIHQIKRCLSQMVLLAGPGVIISTVCLGLVHHYVFPYNWNWRVSLLLGGLLSATDPVAVVALLKDLGASIKLNTIIDGESLMNDGTAMVVFELFHQMTLGTSFSPGEVVLFLCKVALTAVALGIAFGMLSVLWLGFMFNDTIMEITLTFTASYFAFFVAQHVARVSGVLAVMTIGMFFAAFAKTAFRGESQQGMHHFWTMVAYFSNTIIFILSGVVISENFFRSQSLIEARDWGYLLLLYISLQLSRALVVIILYPGLSYCGYGLNWKEAIILVWAGLRGAVALALSLSVNVSEAISEKTRAKFVFFTGGVVLLTLIINGSSTQFLLKFLRMEKTTETKRLVLEHVTYEMNRKAEEAFEELGADEELGPADLPTVRKYISCLDRFHNAEKPTHPHESTSSLGDGRSIPLQDTRLRFLNGVQAAYWQMLEEGRITETAALLLMQSVDEALDKAANGGTLSDWRGLQPHIHMPTYLKHLQTKSFLPKKLMTYLVVGRLELGCYMSAAFLRAHVQVRRHLRDFIGETEIAKTVIKESEEEVSDAKQFLEDIRLTFAQVLRVVKTKQVVHAILLRLLDYIKSLEKSGLLEEKETAQLHDAVQLELKKLLRKPPSIKIPKGLEVLREQPFICALPNHVQARLISSAKESLKLRGHVIFKEGLKADGIWLIANGVVKWSRKDSQSLHPTFAHGSTLGLYEVLMGRPYLCNLTADSAVQCFFIEGSKLLSALQADPGSEHHFWQESTVAVARIILPETFESLPMHELRLLIQNSSTISCIRGEVIELRPGETSLLLDGFVKKDNSDEIIAAPSAIIYRSRDISNSELKIDVHYGNVLNVETRSRVLIVKHGFLSSATSSMSLLPRRSSMGRDSFISGYRGSDQKRKIEQQQSSYSFVLSKPISIDSTSSQLNESQWLRRSTGQLNQQQSTGDEARNRSSSQIPFSARVTQGRLGSMPSIPTATIMQTLPPIRTRRRRKQRSRDSSDASDAEDEHIIQVESPSSLFHNNFNSSNVDQGADKT